MLSTIYIERRMASRACIPALLPLAMDAIEQSSITDGMDAAFASISNSYLN